MLQLGGDYGVGSCALESGVHLENSIWFHHLENEFEIYES